MKRSPFLLAAAVLAAACTSAPKRAEPPPKPGGWLGIRFAKSVLPDTYKDLGLPADSSALLVLGVAPGTPAAVCGLKVGDALTAMDGAPLSSSDPIKAAGEGARVEFSVQRRGSRTSVSCTLGGLGRALSTKVRYDDTYGLVAETFPGLEGDKRLRKLNWPRFLARIRSVDGRAVSTLSELEDALAAKRLDQKVRLEVFNARGAQVVEVGLVEVAPATPERSVEEADAGREGKTWVVSAQGGGDFLTPQGALLRSEPGDTILVRAGRYEGMVTFSVSRRTLRGEGEKTVFAGLLTIGPVHDVTVEDLAVEQLPGVSAAAAGGGSNRMRDVMRGAVQQAVAPKVDAGVFVWSSERVGLRRVSVSGGHPGIGVRLSKAVDVSDCRVTKAHFGFLATGSDAKVERLLAYDNTDGAVVGDDSVATLRGLTLVDNRDKGLVVARSRVELYDSILAGAPTLLSCEGGCRLSGGYNDYFEGSLCTSAGRGSACQSAEGESGLKKETDLSMDPLFAERLRGDYRLSLESPLIGRGRGGGPLGALPPVGSGSGGDGFR